tara:strand:- start:126 stop:353 length:228 start_codon:yes stop_codon:yes gene_type:complete
MVRLSERELRNTTLNFLIVTTVNTDFNTELLEQELTIKNLSDFAGGLTPRWPWDVHVDLLKELTKDLFGTLGIEL